MPGIMLLLAEGDKDEVPTYSWCGECLPPGITGRTVITNLDGEDMTNQRKDYTETKDSYIRRALADLLNIYSEEEAPLSFYQDHCLSKAIEHLESALIAP